MSEPFGSPKASRMVALRELKPFDSRWKVTLAQGILPVTWLAVGELKASRMEAAGVEHERGAIVN